MLQYGLILGVGGLVGYVNSGSGTSAVAGGAAGIFLTFVGYLSLQEYKQSPVTSKLWPGLGLGTLRRASSHGFSIGIITDKRLSATCSRVGAADIRHGQPLQQDGRVLPSGLCRRHERGYVALLRRQARRDPQAELQEEEINALVRQANADGDIKKRAGVSGWVSRGSFPSRPS
jgi:hypothetical protein